MSAHPGIHISLLTADERLLNYPICNTSVLSTCASTVSLVTCFLVLWECTQGFTLVILLRLMPPQVYFALHFPLLRRIISVEGSFYHFLLKCSSSILRVDVLLLCSAPKLEPTTRLLTLNLRFHHCYI